MVSYDYKYTVTALGYIQDIIKRMASNSVLLKGWALSLTAIVIALIPKLDAANSTQTYSIVWFTGLSSMVIIAFSMLDAYYLMQERIFRNEYNRKVSEIEDEEVRGSLTIISLKMVNASYKSSYTSISILPYYLIMVAALFLGMAII